MRLKSPVLRAAPLMLMLYLTASVAVAEVSVKGIKGQAKENVLLTLSLAKERCDAPEWKIRNLYAQADQEIDEALRALGYYHAALEKSLTFDRQCWQARFDIQPGPQAVVSAIDIAIKGEAHDDPEFQKLRNNLPLKIGSPVHHGQYESLKRRFETLALERGYLNAKFTESKLLIDKARNSARIELLFDAGKRMYFGDVTVKQDILNPDFVEKYISIKKGDYYSTEQLAKTQSALSQSDYFDSVEIIPDTENIEQQRVPVSITLSPNNRHLYSFGLGFDTDIGPLGNATYKNRRLNRRGHFLNANLDISPVLSIADVEYSIPMKDPVHDVLSFGGGFRYEDTDTFKSKKAALSVRYKKARPNGWKQTLYLDYSYEEFETETESGEALLLVPGASWLRSVADSIVRPTKGYRAEFEVRGSYETPFSDVSFLQGIFSGIWMQPLPGGGKFIGRTNLGATLVDDLSRLPTSYRFYAGGINSIRGYDYKELGPKDGFGHVKGGEFLTAVSAEYEHPVLDDWGAAAFVDSGNAFNAGDISFKTGVGLGIRWYSPVGPVRLDFAVPLNEANSSFQIHFSAGARL
ncbi:autotransporter assembly complex family protein [Methylobacter sp. BlB1]|uniref:autotransporter assembly complex protein TamA n=1 Tax=Methylobacter sp. BlB1 TaxID=2785914 RepID=UPI0018939651|nr:autotransporter assembly complex family protein [Methylobacter sp. BlB1]MBF6651106.1 outer membrane protein assembly factor [Methylobacter sp. BlB1]